MIYLIAGYNNLRVRREKEQKIAFKETFENLPDKDKELAKEATSMGEIQEIAEIENTRLSLD